MEISVKTCQLCKFKAPNLTYLLKHIRQVHSHQPGFNITCSLSGCQRKFHNFAVYRNHIYDYHTDTENIVQCTTSTGGDNEEEIDDEELLNDMGNEEHSQGFSKQRAAALWILKVQEMYKLPQSTMESILDDVTGLFQDLLMDLCDEVKSVLAKADIAHSDVPGLLDLFASTSSYAQPFAGLNTKHLQLKFYEENFDLVVCVCMSACIVTIHMYMHVHCDSTYVYACVDVL